MKTVILTYDQMYDYIYPTLSTIVSKEYESVDANMFIMQWLEEPILRVKKHVEAIHKTRNALIAKHSTGEKEGKPFLADGSSEQKAFDKEFDKLLEKSVDIPLNETCFRSMKQLKDKGLNFSPQELMVLRHFITDTVLESSKNGAVKKVVVEE